MDQQNNNFENFNNIPREPDFPPKAHSQESQVDKSVNCQTSQVNQPQINAEDTEVNNAENSANQPDLGIPNIPVQNNINNQNANNQSVSSPYSCYENHQQSQQYNAPNNATTSYNQATPQTNFQGANPQQRQDTQQPYENMQQQNQGANWQQQNYQNGYINNPTQQQPNNNQGYPNPYYNVNNNQVYPQQMPYQQQNQGFGYSSQPNSVPERKKNTGLKVFLICLGIVFGICLIVFVSTISYSLGQSVNSNNSSKNGIVLPTEAYNQVEPTTTKVHSESDYSDKVDPSYKGLTVADKVKDSNNSKYTTEYSYETISPSVVGVICYADEVTDASKCTTQGSGIIISEDGFVVTNAHLLNNSKTSYAIQIVTSDGKAYDAGVVGYDTRTDIAVLKTDAKGLTAANFGKSENMEIGASVIAIGNPGGIGYQNSITSGVISAFNRTVLSNTSVKYIQTDAAINPGNSGGPLCNLYGQVIGINTSKIVSEKYEGMGFAIPSETVKTVVDDLIQKGYVSGRVKLGVVGVALSSSDQATYNLPAGIIVESIDENGPLKDSGIQEYDVITKIDGESVATFGEVFTVLEKYKAGDKVTVEVYRSPNFADEEKTFEYEATLIEDKQ